MAEQAEWEILGCSTFCMKQWVQLCIGLFFKLLLSPIMTAYNVYYTIAETNSAEYNQTERRALDLSLQYNFVTDLTSLIVVADKNFTVDDSGSDGLNQELDVTSKYQPDVNCKLK